MNYNTLIPSAIDSWICFILGYNIRSNPVKELVLLLSDAVNMVLSVINSINWLILFLLLNLHDICYNWLALLITNSNIGNVDNDRLDVISYIRDSIYSTFFLDFEAAFL